MKANTELGEHHVDGRRHSVDRDLCSCRTWNQNAVKRRRVVTEVSFVADVDGISLSSFYILGDICASDFRGNHALNIPSSAMQA